MSSQTLSLKVNANALVLKKNYVELTELKQVLTKAHLFFHEQVGSLYVK
jgi:hypothetical protein